VLSNTCLAIFSFTWNKYLFSGMVTQSVQFKSLLPCFFLATFTNIEINFEFIFSSINDLALSSYALFDAKATLFSNHLDFSKSSTIVRFSFSTLEILLFNEDAYPFRFSIILSLSSISVFNFSTGANNFSEKGLGVANWSVKSPDIFFRNPSVIDSILSYCLGGTGDDSSFLPNADFISSIKFFI